MFILNIWKMIGLLNVLMKNIIYFREIYRGNSSFSEPETFAIKEFILKKMKTQEIKVKHGEY